VSDAQTPGRHSRFEVVQGSTYPDWESVYRDNLVGIYQLVYRRVGNVPDAEDLAEEVLMQYRALRKAAEVGRNLASEWTIVGHRQPVPPRPLRATGPRSFRPAPVKGSGAGQPGDSAAGNRAQIHSRRMPGHDRGSRVSAPRR
jgi:hypothetical protein